MRLNDQQAPGMRQIRGVYQYIYRHVGNREEAEALTERVFTLEIQSPATCDARGPSTQATRERRLAQRARDVVTEYLRGFSPTLPPLPDDDIIAWPDPTDTGGLSDISDAGERAARILAQLSAQDRDFLTYRFLDNRSLAETAARMRITLAQALAMQWSALSHAGQLEAPQASNCPEPCGAGGELVGEPC